MIDFVVDFMLDFMYNNSNIVNWGVLYLPIGPCLPTRMPLPQGLRFDLNGTCVYIILDCALKNSE